MSNIADVKYSLVFLFLAGAILFLSVFQNFPVMHMNTETENPAGDAVSSYNADTSTLELCNDSIKIQLDLNSGGAISYLSIADSDRNLVNIHDRGRYIQQSYYAGQNIDRQKEGQSPAWSPWPWNPIQVGDYYGNSSKVLDYKIENHESGDMLYVKTQPLLWDMKNEPGQCWFEMWVGLDGNHVSVRNRLTCFRSDNTWESKPCHQELPAVYTIGDLGNLYTYVGDTPWENGELTKIKNNGPPWEYWNTPEHWAALVDDKMFGVGVYNKVCDLFCGGYHGTPGGESTDGSTGYISPLLTVKLEKSSVFEYEYTLIIGSLQEIRDFAYQAHLNKEND